VALSGARVLHERKGQNKNTACLLSACILSVAKALACPVPSAGPRRRLKAPAHELRHVCRRLQSCAFISNTRIWSAVGFSAVRVVPGLPRLDLAATEGKGAGWVGRATMRHLRLCLSLRVCMRARASVRMCTCVRHLLSLIQSHSCLCAVLVCAHTSTAIGSLNCKAAPLGSTLDSRD
jgi:hypothetical protein